MASGARTPSLLVTTETVPTGSATGNPRNKTALKPGRSLMDWIRLGHSGKDLTGVGGKLRQVTPQELSTHNRPDDAWIALKGVVYNVTHYMEYHPGGQEELMRGVGKEAIHLFNEVHQWVNAESMLQKCVVGKLSSPPISASLFAIPSVDGLIKMPTVKSSPQLKPPTSDVVVATNCYRRCTLRAKTDVTHNTRLFRFDLPVGDDLAVPVGRHVHLRAIIQGTEVFRSYTPVPSELPSCLEPAPKSGRGSLWFMIKVYPDGALTPYLDSMAIGDTIDMSESLGSFEEDQWRSRKSLLLLAAGTGFTPMCGLLLRALGGAADRTAKLLFFNRQERDILWRKQLDALAEVNPRFEVVNVLSEAGSEWAGATGRIHAGFVRDALPDSVADDGDSSCGPERRPLVAVCGPPEFIRAAIRILEEVGVPAEDVHAFDG